jgi:hypothetical protein
MSHIALISAASELAPYKQQKSELVEGLLE